MFLFCTLLIGLANIFFINFHNYSDPNSGDTEKSQRYMPMLHYVQCDGFNLHSALYQGMKTIIAFFVQSLSSFELSIP